MWDAVVGVGLVAVAWLHPYKLRRLPLAGYPLALGVVGAAWTLHLLPAPCYQHAPSLYDVATRSLPAAAALAGVVDLVQYGVHRATHAHALGRALHDAHAVHHQHLRPTPLHAFHTGILDALAQLLLPLLASVALVRPDRTSLLIFGMAYSHWLLFLHSPPSPRRDALLARAGLVSPTAHARHHTHPHEHLSHLVVWEAAGFFRRWR